MTKTKRINILLFLFLFCFCSFSFAGESLEKFQAGLLKSNFNETPYTALVKITDVKKANRKLLYPTYLLICEVIETYKGKDLKQIKYLRGVEEGYKNLPTGKSYIVSLFFNTENGFYYMGDNGYDLPASRYLIKIARKLKEKRKTDPELQGTVRE